MTKYRRKILEHVEIKETFKQTKVTCDFCGQDVVKVAREQGNNSENIEIKAEIGNIWEGGEADVRDGYQIDVCSKCFIDKVKPALEAAGGSWHKYRPEEAYVNSKYTDLWTNE